MQRPDMREGREKQASDGKERERGAARRGYMCGQELREAEQKVVHKGGLEEFQKRKCGAMRAFMRQSGRQIVVAGSSEFIGCQPPKCENNATHPPAAAAAAVAACPISLWMHAIHPTAGFLRVGSASVLAFFDRAVLLTGSTSAHPATNTPAVIVHRRLPNRCPQTTAPIPAAIPRSLPQRSQMSSSFGDLKSVVRSEPCAREGLLYGLGSGAAAAMLGLFKRGSLLSAGNWGVTAFAVVAVAAKQLCHFQHAHERAIARTLLDKHNNSTGFNVDGFRPAAPPVNQPPPKQE
ncbi:hypothetical protein H4S08_002276 [Coemansia sp. RSA 1365]|nr:hypothetical protein H4S08_002276 [Coemansia sp. RSA 1365]